MSGIAIRSGNISPFRVGTFGADPATQDVMDVIFDANASPLRISQLTSVYVTGGGYPERRPNANTQSGFALAHPVPAGQYPLFCAAYTSGNGFVDICPYKIGGAGYGAATGSSSGMGIYFNRSQPIILPSGQQGDVRVPSGYVSVLVFRNRF